MYANESIYIHIMHINYSVLKNFRTKNSTRNTVD